MSDSTATLLQRLRDETIDVHQELERQLPLTSPNLTLDEYRFILERFYCFYRYFESEVLPQLPQDWRSLFAGRQKLPALLCDLEFLGSTNEHLSDRPELPRYTTLPQILGALYVTEGATLGGKLITRHVQKLLGLNENEGLAYFSSYGSEVGPMWKAFREKLAQSSSPHWDDEIVASARRTFKALQHCLVD